MFAIICVLLVALGRSRAPAPKTDVIRMSTMRLATLPGSPAVPAGRHISTSSEIESEPAAHNPFFDNGEN